MGLVLESRDVQRLLRKLLNRTVKVTPSKDSPDHPVTRRALVNDDDGAASASAESVSRAASYFSTVAR